MRAQATVISLLVLCGAATPAAAQLTQAQRDATVASHNTARGNARPAPFPILPSVAWSSSVETTAQSWADNCAYGHSGTFGVGENLYASSGTPLPPPPTPADVVGAWVGEAAGYDYATNVCSVPPCGHYTQVVWRESTLVGCGFRQCSVNSPFGNGQDWYFWVCQYSPPGNVIPLGHATPDRPYYCDYAHDGTLNDLCIGMSDGFESGDLGRWSAHKP